jgi:GLPGLI family protein
MKKTLIVGLVIASGHFAAAQQTSGKITYERVVQMQVRLNDAHMNEEMQNMLPKTRKDNFELIFGDNQSLWKQQEKEMEDANTISDGGMQIRVTGGGSDDVLYNNFTSRTKTEQREFFDKKFIIDDSIRSLKWKMTGETKMILGHNCMKATASQISRRNQMSMENGKMERKEIEDTSVVIAWFATDIPVQAGPAEYQGQLPGAILEMDVANGRQTFKAINISTKADLAQIKAPTGKKRYTTEEYQIERNKMMDQMQKNGGGGGRVVRFDN